ncbi:hypothetical protein MKW92_019218, partial [Papaver armeniacum]
NRVVHQTVKDVISDWKEINFSERGRQLWKRLPAAIMWGLWKARNAIVFDGQIFKLIEVIRDIKIDTFNWVKGLHCFKGVNTSLVLVEWENFFVTPH